jgi:hypothetical protein
MLLSTSLVLVLVGVDGSVLWAGHKSRERMLHGAHYDQLRRLALPKIAQQWLVADSRYKRLKKRTRPLSFFKI